MTARYLTIVAIALIGLPMMLSAADTTVIAKVGDNEVRAEDIKPFIEKLPVRDQLILSKDPAAMNEFVRNIIIQQLVYKEALSKKWEQQPQVAAQLDRIRQQAITQSYLQSLATPPADYPSQAELQSAYEALKKNNALQVPKQYHLAQIYVACPKGCDKDTEAKAQAKLDVAVKAIKSGDFAAVAKSQSDDASSAQRGGDLGFLPESQIQPEIKTAAAALAKGGVSDPVRLNDGWHLIKVLEVKEPYTATLDEVKGSLSNELRSQRAQVLGKSYLAQLLQQNPVTLNEIAVSKLVNPKGN
ncbi:MAG: peptidylprolyl isomerase [Chthoniobacterales bacterium]